MVNLKYIVIFGCLLTIACADQKLILRSQRIDQSRLKLHGVYINKWDWDMAGENDFVTILIPYENATIFRSSEKKNKLLNNFEQAIHNMASRERKYKTSWGRFNIEVQSIITEFWNPSSGGGMKTGVSKGKILNDSTFVVQEWLDNYTNKKRTVQARYQFYPVQEKPDSTNNYVNQ